MKFLPLLKKISNDHKTEGSFDIVLDKVEELLEEGLEQFRIKLNGQSKSAPVPLDKIWQHAVSDGGKQVRPILCLLSCRAFDAQKWSIELATVCELLHNATLLHDDVIDEGDMRRGKDAARKVWTNALSILGGDYMLITCIDMISTMGDQYLKDFVSTLRKLVEGEILQLALRNRIDVSSEEYFDVVKNKTASLFMFSTSSGARFGGADEEAIFAFKQFGYNLGIAFQLIDDVLDFDAQPEALGKDLFADICQGKMTLPLIITASKDKSVLEPLDKLVKGGTDIECVNQIVQLVNQAGALEEVRNKAFEITENSFELLDKAQLGNNEVLKLLKELAFVLINRRY